MFTQRHLLPVALKACAEAEIAREKVVLIGDEREEGFLHFTDLMDESPKGERVKLDPARDLAFLVYSSGTTGLPKVSYCVGWIDLTDEMEGCHAEPFECGQ